MPYPVGMIYNSTPIFTATETFCLYADHISTLILLWPSVSIKNQPLNGTRSQRVTLGTQMVYPVRVSYHLSATKSLLLCS